MSRILIVEDNDDNLNLMTFILKSHKHEVIAEKTGVKGVETAIREKPDLILMDIQLPDINGLEATRRIRNSEADGDIPIIAVTSYAMVGDQEKTLEAGCNDYIEKPIDPEKIMEQINKHLK